MIIDNPMVTQNYTYVIEDNGHCTYKINDVNTDNVLSLVKFQKGAIKDFGLNGIFNEDLILMIIDRLEFFQTQELKCQENDEALKKLYEALMWLRKRTLDRKNRGVQGTSEV